MVHWGLGILLVLATVSLATPLLGRLWAWVAGALVVLTPAINQQMSLPTESVALAAFCTLALAAWSQAVIHGASRRWFIVAGLSAGGALGVHYAAALLIPVVAGAWAWAALHRVERCRQLLRGGTVVVLVAVGAGVLGRLFSIWPVAQLACLASAHTSPLALPDHLGMVLLAAAPGVLLVRRLRGLGTLLSAALLDAVLAFSLSGDSRLLFSAVPLLSVAAVWVCIEMRRFPPAARWLGGAAFAVLIACSMAVSLVRSRDALEVALGLEDREEYLLRREPTYVAATIANHVLRTNARLLSQERQAFYFDCPVTCENSLARAIGGDSPALSVQETVQRLVGAGFTHLLLAETAPNGPQSPASPLRRVADVTPSLTDYCFRTADGSVRRYRLLMLR